MKWTIRIFILLLAISLFVVQITKAEEIRTDFTKYWINVAGNVHREHHIFFVYVERDTYELKMKEIGKRYYENVKVHFIEGNTGYFIEEITKWFNANKLTIYLPKGQ